MVTSLSTPPTPTSTLHRMSTFTRKILWRAAANNDENANEPAPTAVEVQHSYRERTFLRPPALKNNGKVVDENEGHGDGNLTDQVDEGDDDDESSKSFTESQTENDVTPLHKEAAMEVNPMLMSILNDLK